MFLKQKMQKDDSKSHQEKQLARRMNLIFFIIFVLFTVLIVRLGYVQIVQGEVYRSEVEREETTIIYNPVPRGKIYDRNHHLIVYNIPENAITFTPPKHPKSNELFDLAKKLAQMITMTEKDVQKVTTRDLKDMWLLQHQNGEELITEKEKKKLNDQELYQVKLERISEKNLEELDRNVAAIFRKLSVAVALTPTIIKNENVTDIEFARISENLASLPGVDVTTDWKRGSHYGDTFWNMIGEVTSTDEGLPAEMAEYYQARDYKLNDRVGKSYLEEQYDDLLQGQKIKIRIATNQEDDVVEREVISEGEPGKDLVLTIDMKLQAEVEKIMEEELLTAIRKPHTETLDTAFVVAMEPKTGNILAMSGKVYDRKSKKFYDYTPGTFTYAFEQGSVVKGATLLAGYQTGVRKIGETEMDEVLHIKGSGTFSSSHVMNRINDLRAIESSSNVYMWLTAIEIMNGKYVRNGPLKYDPEKIETIRYYFNQFGLGVPTGIGFENEAIGVKGTNQSTYFQIAIGQLDTYTPMQIAQYISTIANDGYRMKPHLVKEIREQNNNGEPLGNVIERLDPVVLNRLDMKDEYIKRVQQGLWQVTHGSQGTARRYFMNEPYNVAGKTGTAESFKNGIKTWNQSFAGYAPFDDPQIALAVIVPNAYIDGYSAPHSTANMISQRIFRTFFNK
ncbi:peptidoglycan D,D-transpeptidase FtsI family protein [Robertmurraya kyonggiensis]|uniref:serine-type D-Ala-D-Ala carboxypeptidase n=1 Tax=Robertmurraya kyonggiensis TaxID=1037680 RepID=A0A4U1D9C1_9BACI|nr:penicillin-binding protein 2 [Robertmurraya kyonggiensis]TKC19139.1 penicillin-binding protein 2 [Robertmurraya kyonggiensis]